jgi:hypothetical protein
MENNGIEILSSKIGVEDDFGFGKSIFNSSDTKRPLGNTSLLYVIMNETATFSSRKGRNNNLVILFKR